MTKTQARSAAASGDESSASLLELLLADQADLTAVGRFAQRHAADALPQQERWYRDLIPLERPGEGQQYGFEVDLDACTGCKACVTACRSLNGLDEDESWRTVGLLHGTSQSRPVLQTVTTACHHCVDPACLKGCPVDAYEKDVLTGIVRHLDDQCIGCGYCMFTCPYDVPVYNAARGIVRKCDMCSDRLAAGEAPACVQACPNEAIRINVVDVATVVARTRTGGVVPGAAPSSITAPATVYRSAHGEADLVAADRFAVSPAHAHPPLAVMLVLTQLSVGAFATDLVLRAFAHGHVLAVLRPYTAAAALAAGLLALGASVLHLGRPLYAFRAAIGFRHSWLSREILAFGAFAGLAALYAVALWTVPGGPLLSMLGASVAVAGAAGVVCSVMVYAVTRRTWWRARSVAVKFAGTTAVCGLAAVLVTTVVASLVAAGSDRVVHPLAVVLAAASAGKLAWEGLFFRHLLSRSSGDLRATALLLSRELGAWTVWRFVLGAAGGVAAPMLVLATRGGASAVIAALGLVAVVAGELVERSQFFRAVTSPSMPGERGR